MKKTISYIICALSLVACGDDADLVLPDTQDVVPLAGIDAEVYSGASTRAPALDKDNHVGRSVFVNADQMVLTSIKRTQNPVPKFSYKGIVYDYSVEKGQTYGSWNRDEKKGCTEADPNTVPLRIYWSDAASAHTYIGYSLPQTTRSFTWTESGGTYTGQLLTTSTTTGETTATFIDHTTNEKIIQDDLLLTYDDAKLAETGGSVAKLYFYHALANVRVIVNISGFSASDKHDDVKSKVHDMVLKEMPIYYQWNQTSAGVTALSNSQEMDTHMWIPRQDGTGTGVGKQFTFYALAVPRTGVSQAISFKVTYPNPMKPDKELLTNTYTTSISGIEYRAGFCTTITITLNHQNEDITVGAEYMDWQYVETPDQSELKKNSTMMSKDMLTRNSFTLLGDDKANADDATWLYVDPTTQKIVDIYGNDGSAYTPFVIATAQQLVAFANEVKGIGRTGSVTYKNQNSADKTLAAGASFDFTDYYVKLDADIVMQPELEVDATSRVTWCGIGDDTHVFNGKFLGGRRTIRSLYGSPFFYKLGPQAVVEQLNFMDVIEVDGRGIIANESRGLIAAVFANGPIRQKEPTDKSIYSGSLVGTVEAEGVVISCAHFGDVEAWADANGVIGGLVGYNKGLLLSCYHSGKEKNLAQAGYHTYAGVGKHEEGSYAFSCYYNIDADPEKSDYASLEHGKHAFPVHIDVMQSNKFVNGTDDITVLKDDNIDHTTAHSDWINQHKSLNNALAIFYTHVVNNTIPQEIQNNSHANWYMSHYLSYEFSYSPGEYPRVK